MREGGREAGRKGERKRERERDLSAKADECDERADVVIQHRYPHHLQGSELRARVAKWLRNMGGSFACTDRCWFIIRGGNKPRSLPCGDLLSEKAGICTD